MLRYLDRNRYFHVFSFSLVFTGREIGFLFN